MQTTGQSAPYWQPGIHLGLERVRALRARHSPAPDPFRPHWRMVHIAGTKGKGSTTEFLRRLLLAAGHRVGAFFSPYVRFPEEQIQIGDRPISRSLFQETMARLQTDAIALGATEFEVVTAAAYLLFDLADIDFAIVEVGVGGREDATNIILNPALTVLTPIGLDHQDLLGNSIESIAGHKAGILKTGVPAVVHVPDPLAHQVIAQEMESLGLSFTDLEYHSNVTQNTFVVKTPFGNRGPLRAGMQGYFQQQNAATAVLAVDLLAAHGHLLPLTPDTLQSGLDSAALPGRYETVQVDPVRVIVDGAHNGIAATALAEAIRQEMRDGRLFFIVGMKRNHEILPFLQPLAALNPTGLVATAPSSDRGAVHTPETIVAAALSLGIPVLAATPDLTAARNAVSPLLSPGDTLIVCGSFLLVGELHDASLFAPDPSQNQDPA